MEDFNEELTVNDLDRLVELVGMGITAETEKTNEIAKIKTIDDIFAMAIRLGSEKDIEIQMLKHAPPELVNTVVEKFMEGYLEKSRYDIEKLVDITTKLHLLKSRI